MLANISSNIIPKAPVTLLSTYLIGKGFHISNNLNAKKATIQ